ncbi:MAG: small multi-drug export protein [bacterium]|nr:small multi-drug export protein [bacterium]
MDYSFLLSKIGSAELTTFVISMLPIVELRGALPIALVHFGLHFWPAYFWSVLGNILPAVFFVFFLEKIADYLSHRSYWFNRFFAWLFERTRQRHNHHFEIWGSLALVLFVAIPLPFTGAWSGAAAAFVFGIPPKRSIPSIIIGVLIAGLIVGSISLGILNLPQAASLIFK